MFLDHSGWSSLDKRVVLQFCLNGPRFLSNPRDFIVQPLALARLVRSGDSEKKFAQWSEGYWSASRRLVFGVERYLLRI